MTQERLEEALCDLDAPDAADERLRAACRATIPVPVTSQRVRWEWNPFAQKGVKALMLPRTLVLGTAAAVAAVAAFSYGWQKRVAKVASAPVATNQSFDMDSPDSLAGMWSLPHYRIHYGGLFAGVPVKVGVTFEELSRSVRELEPIPEGGVDIAFDSRYGRRIESYYYKAARFTGKPRIVPREQVARYSELHLADGTKLQRSPRRDGSGYDVKNLPAEQPPNGNALGREARSLSEYVRKLAGADLILTYSAELPPMEELKIEGPFRQFKFQGKSFPELKGITIRNQKRPDVAPYLMVEAIVDVTSRRLVRLGTWLVWGERTDIKSYITLMTSEYVYEAIPRSAFNPEDFKRGVLRYDPESEVQTEKVEFTPGVFEKTQEYRIVLSDADGTRVIYRQTLKPGEAMKPQNVRAQGSECRIQILNASGQNVYDHKWTDNRIIRDPVK